jgi:hypothetical protein
VVEGTLSLRPDILVTIKPYSAGQETPAAAENKPKADAAKSGK